MYVKLFGSILHSSIWDTDPETRIVWITMLAMADEGGIVNASIGGLAHQARVPRKACERALRIFLRPDADSRDRTEGCRIREVQGGWLLLNYQRYRELQTRKQAAAAARQARYRARHVGDERDASVTGVTDNTSNAASRIEREAEADAHTEKSTALVALKRDALPVPHNGGKLKSTALSAEALIAGLQDVSQQTARRQTAETFRGVMVEIIFAYWAKRLGHERALLDTSRRHLLTKRLVENSDNLSELLYVVDGALKDDWTMGRDPKSRRKYDGVETIFRDREQVERFAATIPTYKQGKPHPMAEKYAGTHE